MLRDLIFRERRSPGRRPRTGQPASLGDPDRQAPISRISTPKARTLLVPIVSTAAFILALFLTTRPARAEEGPNKGGVLILHCNPSLQFTADGDFSGYAELYDAKNAVTQVAGDGEGVVYFVLAAFDDFAMPRLKTLSFGLQLTSSTVQPTRWGPTIDPATEIPVGPWPSSGSGVGLTWLQADTFTRRLNEIYWFCGYAYAGQTVKLVKCPGQPGIMGDDDFPAHEDEIKGYGMLGFGVAGYNPLVEPTANGACCSASGRCILQTESGCKSMSGYTYSGDLTYCSPNPCTPGVGACCIRAECRMLPWDECTSANGVFFYGSSCNPTPCDFTRVGTTWGVLKSTYRQDR
jgi:hypothetical protein